VTIYFISKYKIIIKEKHVISTMIGEHRRIALDYLFGFEKSERWWHVDGVIGDQWSVRTATGHDRNTRLDNITSFISSIHRQRGFRHSVTTARSIPPVTYTQALNFHVGKISSMPFLKLHHLLLYTLEIQKTD
jgi:hypothetical protein